MTSSIGSVMVTLVVAAIRERQLAIAVLQPVLVGAFVHSAVGPGILAFPRAHAFVQGADVAVRRLLLLIVRALRWRRKCQKTLQVALFVFWSTKRSGSPDQLP